MGLCAPNLCSIGFARGAERSAIHRRGARPKVTPLCCLSPLVVLKSNKIEGTTRHRAGLSRALCSAFFYLREFGFLMGLMKIGPGRGARKCVASGYSPGCYAIGLPRSAASSRLEGRRGISGGVYAVALEADVCGAVALGHESFAISWVCPSYRGAVDAR